MRSSPWVLPVSIFAGIVAMTLVRVVAGDYVRQAPVWVLLAAVLVGCALIAALAIYSRRRRQPNS